MSRFVDLSHVLEPGMPVYPGFPAPDFTPLLTREDSRERYQGKAEFLLGRADLPGNTGTYLDAPFHRHPSRPDLAAIPLQGVAGLPGRVVEGRAGSGRGVDIELGPDEVRGRAVLVRTGWDERWGSDRYWEPGPFVSAQAIDLLIEGQAALVGVDFWNVDDTDDPSRPAHTHLLAADVLIVEHLCNLSELPAAGFRFFAAPLPITGGASFPVRAFAELDR